MAEGNTVKVLLVKQSFLTMRVKTLQNLAKVQVLFWQLTHKRVCRSTGQSQSGGAVVVMFVLLKTTQGSSVVMLFFQVGGGPKKSGSE